MTTFCWMVLASACAQVELPAGPLFAIDGEAGRPAASEPRPATSRIDSVKVFQGQALVTRVVDVPEGEGTIELVVSPLPDSVVEASLDAEGGEGLRVLSTRFRSRIVADDPREEVREKELRLAELRAELDRLEREMEAQEQDLGFLQKLEGFTGSALGQLSEQGRLDSESIVALSRYLMETRGAKTEAESGLRRRIEAVEGEAEAVRRQVQELASRTNRVERDALITVSKAGAAAATARLSYLVGSARWSPQYRLRAGADDEPVELEYLAAVFQQSGEDWADVEVSLSTARPTLDASPPDLQPLRMAIGRFETSTPIEAGDERSRRISEELDRLFDMPYENETPLADVIEYIRQQTRGTDFPGGLPIHIDPIGLLEADRTPQSPVTIAVQQVPLRTALEAVLDQLDLSYVVRGGMLTIISRSSTDVEEEAFYEGAMGGMGGGMGGMGGSSLELSNAAGDDLLNRSAASDQAAELRVLEGNGETEEPVGRDLPSVTFAIDGRLDVPSRREPQLLEVTRVELVPEYFAKAVPVLTSRVYRQAKLTNTSAQVLLPGEATVYVGRDFVGRTRLPLVAAGEPFLAGFGVDPQLQVTRRLMSKHRTIQGGNQVLSYEFRLGLRNYRPGPVRVELWDRLPRPEGEMVGVSLVETSAELSDDALYLRTARMDNLLRWDLEVPEGTVGERALYVNYEFRLEYARDLPPPSFVSGSLREAPIGGGAMGGMGGGFRSIEPGATDRDPALP